MKNTTIQIIMAIGAILIAGTAIAEDDKRINEPVAGNETEQQDVAAERHGRFLVTRDSHGRDARPEPVRGDFQPEYRNFDLKRGSPFEQKLTGKSARAAQMIDTTVVIDERPAFVDLVRSDTRTTSAPRIGKDGERMTSYPAQAQMESPSDGATLSSVQTFHWSPPAGHVVLWVGSWYSGADIAELDLGYAQSATALIPTDGRTVYVALWTYYKNQWYSERYTYTAPSSRQPSVMDFPAAGATLGTTQTFRWTAGAGVSAFWFSLGSCRGCWDLYDSYAGQDTSITLSDLPTDGRAVYATIFSSIAGEWYQDIRAYRAYTRTNGNIEIEVENKLIYPVTLSVNGEEIATLDASSTGTYSISESTFQLSFVVEGPFVGGKTLGDTMSGQFTEIADASGRYRFLIDNVIGTSYFFAPLITNLTASPQWIRVNGGLTVENTCDCYVPASYKRAGSGYYRLYLNSNVMLSTSRTFNGYRFWGVNTDGRIGGDYLYKLIAEDSGDVELTLR